MEIGAGPGARQKKAAADRIRSGKILLFNYSQLIQPIQSSASREYFIAACAAARRAIGTRNGEQET